MKEWRIWPQGYRTAELALRLGRPLGEQQNVAEVSMCPRITFVQSECRADALFGAGKVLLTHLHVRKLAMSSGVVGIERN